jgi:hypothetical protein
MWEPVGTPPRRRCQRRPTAEPEVTFAEPTEPITLTFHGIGTSGYGDLVTEFMRAHPEITVEVAEHKDLAMYVKQVAAGKVTGDVMTLEVASIAKERTRPPVDGPEAVPRRPGRRVLALGHAAGRLDRRQEAVRRAQ